MLKMQLSGPTLIDPATMGLELSPGIYILVGTSQPMQTVPGPPFKRY